MREKKRRTNLWVEGVIIVGGQPFPTVRVKERLHRRIEKIEIKGEKEL